MDIAEKKPWYKSKLILIGISSVGIFGSNYLFGWLSGQGVTPDQLNSIEIVAPEVAKAVERVQTGENVLTVIGSLFGVLVLVFRAWFTTKSIG